MCTDWVGPNRSEGLSYHHNFVDLGWDSIGVIEMLIIAQNSIVCFISAMSRQGTIYGLFDGVLTLQPM